MLLTPKLFLIFFATEITPDKAFGAGRGHRGVNNIMMKGRREKMGLKMGNLYMSYMYPIYLVM
jgi:hypothetical protein